LVLYGLLGGIRVAGKDYKAAAMPSFGLVAGSAFDWSDDKEAKTLTYVRQEWGNNAPPIGRLGGGKSGRRRVFL
jgi:hypothetical protein